MLLIFYPADWSPVCSDELVIFNEALPEFRKYQTGLLGISVNGPWCHRAFAENRRIHFPLLSDFEPKGATARKYGVYRDKAGVCERAFFLIDQDQTIAWSYLSPIGENPGADGALDTLRRLTKNL